MSDFVLRAGMHVRTAASRSDGDVYRLMETVADPDGLVPVRSCTDSRYTLMALDDLELAPPTMRSLWVTATESGAVFHEFNSLEKAQEDLVRHPDRALFIFEQTYTFIESNQIQEEA